MKMELHVHFQRREALLFLITNMAAVTSSANRQCTSIFYFLGARDFSSAVSAFCQVFIAARGFGLRPPKMCRPSANTENSRCRRVKPLVPRVVFKRLCRSNVYISPNEDFAWSWAKRPDSRQSMPLQTYLHIAVENGFKLFLRHTRNLGNEIHKLSTNAVVSRDFSCLRKETEEFNILGIRPPTHPSDNLTLTPTSHFGQNVGLTIGWVGRLPDYYFCYLYV